MSGSEHSAHNGSDHGHSHRDTHARPSRTMSARSASPAKRTATEMEENGTSSTNLPQNRRESSPLVQDEAAAREDVAMAADTSVENCDGAQDVVMTSFSGATPDAAPRPASRKSEQQDDPSAYTAKAQARVSAKEPYSTEEIDAQVSRVLRLSEKQLDEGDRGVVLSKNWLSRVLARTSDGLHSTEFPKDAREGLVGPVDNADIVEDGAYSNTLVDAAGHAFIPLRAGLLEDQDFQIIPFDAYGDVARSFGALEEAPIVRYAHNTVDGGAQNIQYELYPPRITICKVPQPTDPEQPAKSLGALENLRQSKEQAARGQKSPDDAAQLVISRKDRFQRFLGRAKDAAGIPQATKVKVWRVRDPSKLAVSPAEAPQVGVQTPPASREASPTRASPKLVVGTSTFKALEDGGDIEHVNVKDQTGDVKFNGTSSAEIFGFTTDQTIILEEQIGGPGGGEFASDNQKSSKFVPKKLPSGSRTVSATASGRTSPAPGSISTRGRVRKGGRPLGLNGLTNLGNTCYMNAALQCIRNIEELTVYFLMNKYKAEINNDNPLGHHGAIANAYSGVVRGLWTTDSTFTPTNFKRQIGNVNYQFSSYGQQDSQEFLSTLVDALHEDLNRILVKPYQPYPDSDDNTVHDPQAIIELGNVYRKIFTDRNASVAMDLFLGFYKNTIECPDCKKVSITFDPYSSLTLQLPIEDSFSHRVAFIPLQGKPVSHDIDMDKNSTIKAVKQFIASKHDGVDPARLWMVEQYNHKVFKVFDDSWTLSESGIGASDHIFLFELDNIPTNIGLPKRPTYMSSRRVDDSIPQAGMDSPQADCMAVPILHRIGKSNAPGYREVPYVLHPMYITLTREEAKDYQVILKKVLRAVSQLTTRPILPELNFSSAEDNAQAPKPPGLDDNATVSDHSADEEYVNVSFGTQRAETSAASADGESRAGLPEGFMDAHYVIPSGLRDHLFELKVGSSSDNMHCASMSGVVSSTIKNMLDQVKQHVRRSSTQSVASTATTAVSASDDEEAETADEATEAAEDVAEESKEEQDEPDIVVGGEVSPEPSQIDDSDTETATGEIMEPSPVAPRNPRKRGNKKIRRGKHGRMLQQRPNRHDLPRQGHLNRANGPSMPAPSATPQPRSATNPQPYYVRIGQAIVLDWIPEAFEGLFGGESSSADETRGSRTTDDDGKNIELFPDPDLQAKKERRRLRSKNGITLDACFEETSKSEVLSEENAWYCNRCKEKRRATKQLQIWTLPDILVVHLKRFSNRTMRGKIDVMVDYPIEGLDLNSQVGLKEDDKDYTYDLFAVDNHSGSLGGGHYYAFAKNFQDGHWYDYNDSSCHKISNLDRLKTAQAYLLFYRRRSDKPLGPEYLQNLVYEYRNPPPSEDAEDSDTGEGRLGGPVTSLHGSSSDSAAAGAGAKSILRASGAGGSVDGALVDSSRTTRVTTTTMRETESDDDTSPLRPQHYPGIAAPSWSFDAVDEVMRTSDDDAATSTTAEMDRDSAYDDGNSCFEDAEDHRPSSPMDTHEIFEDTHMGSPRDQDDDDDEIRVADMRVSPSDRGDHSAEHAAQN